MSNSSWIGIWDTHQLKQLYYQRREKKSVESNLLWIIQVTEAEKREWRTLEVRRAVRGDLSSLPACQKNGQKWVRREWWAALRRHDQIAGSKRMPAKGSMSGQSLRSGEKRFNSTKEGLTMDWAGRPTTVGNDRMAINALGYENITGGQAGTNFRDDAHMHRRRSLPLQMGRSSLQPT